ADEFEGELKDSTEGKVFWIKRADLEKYELSYDLMEIMEVIENDKITELRYYMEDGEWKSVYE
ncbi:MAG: DNA mismatch repair protein MutT, partial [Erysipelotrichaceae bacterium]|nr:DNA mismatch repair protein MutT [Erysipelotrichaceae bacterium]